MPRYFIKLAYKGTHFAGWQSQLNAITVQGEIEKALSKIIGSELTILGCGRTDAGVHASCFYAHMDYVPGRYTAEEIFYKLNSMLTSDITVYDILEVGAEAHARFDATDRSYIYKLSLLNDPFSQDTKYKFDQADTIDFKLLEESTEFLVGKHDFYTFCKSHTDVNNYICKVKSSEWQKLSEVEYHYHITANRFLRGMVRMIVGMSLNVAMKRIDLESVITAFKKQERLQKAWSVPAHGLFLSNIKYPFDL